MSKFLTLTLCAAIVSSLSGCSDKPESKPAPEVKAPTGDDRGPDHHGHGAGPHEGTLTDWGGGAYHVEFTVDHDKKETTVYILGGDEKTPAPIKAESIQLTINDPMTEMELTAMPLEGETDGMSSRFVGTHDTIGIVKEFGGTISGVIDGTPYTGDFQEEPHGADHQH